MFPSPRRVFPSKNYNLFTCLVREMFVSTSLNQFKDLGNKLRSILRCGIVNKCIQNGSIHQHNIISAKVINIWTRQCECVLAQKLRRGQQMFSLYSKLWEEKALKELISRMRHGMIRKSKDFLFGACGVSLYNWDKNRISDKEMKEQIKEFDYVNILKERTVCKKCHKRKPNRQQNICHCENKEVNDSSGGIFQEWETFIEKKDLVVWRRMTKSGHFEYKVYGSYHDVTAADFLNVQVDTKYRRVWDATAIVLDVIETDPNIESKSDVLYWEMLWPSFFSNRDYVFIRRYMIDFNTNTIIIANKTTKHQKVGEKADKVRVQDYWSYMVIKPYCDLNQKGVEFVLTYFDNPGVSIPQTVTNWVAMRAMPDFLERLRVSTRGYKAYCEKAGVKCVCQVIPPVKKKIILEETVQTRESTGYFEPDEDLITDNTISEAQHNLNYSRYRSPGDPPKTTPLSSDCSENNSSDENSDSSTPIQQNGTKTIWRYLHPTYYFS